MKLVAIIDGIAEGKWNTNNFRQALRQHGYKVIDNIESADIIVAHSAGCFYLPKTNNEQLILLINPPYWPGRFIGTSIILKIYKDFIYRWREHQMRYWLVKNLVSLGYFFTDIFRSIQIGLFVRRRDLLDKLPNKKLVLIRNDDDAWCTPDISKIPFKNKHVQFFALPGEHDDCWTNPEPYIKLLNELGRYHG